jgi:UDP-N-acetylglucosamine--N-acetylmuramyl-(pentapeptide) pyrophosphoryl-undecaprenol N-acetylglucosamine transferase
MGPGSETGRRTMRLVFAGGGTGGHLYPGIAIAEEIRRRCPEASIVFIGNGKTLEARIVPERGFRFLPISVAGFRRAVSPDALVSIVRLIVALVQSFLLIRKEKPDVVIGTGGYVCGPPLFMASALGIPTLIQEQNSYPGLTTRLLAGRVTEVHLSFERTKRFLKRSSRVMVTGNPTREAIGTVARAPAAARMGVRPDRFTLLVVGGSRGARSINDAIAAALPALAELKVQLLWITGKDDVERARAAAGAVRERDVPVRIAPYVEEMEFAYGTADLVVCRAGATTIAELARAGLPSVLVPYPFAAADHQTENARAMVDGGASVMVPDAQLAEQLVPALRELLEDRDRLRAMGLHARALAAPRATEVLAESVIRLAGESCG